MWFIGYLDPSAQIPESEQRQRCVDVAAAVGAEVNHWVVETAPLDRTALITFIDRGGREVFANAVMLVPSEAVVLDNRLACYWVHLRYVDVADVSELHPQRDKPHFHELFWRKVRGSYRAYRERSTRVLNEENLSRLKNALVTDQELLDEAFQILRDEKQTSQDGVAYLLSKLPAYEGITDKALQQRLSRALRRSNRRTEFKNLCKSNKVR